MYLGFTVIVALLATSCVLVFCSEADHLVPKHTLASKHSRRKRDLSGEDVELILKALLAKMKHSEDAELIHKETSNDKGHYMHGSEMMDKSHLASMKEEEMAYLGKGQPMEHEYMKEKFVPLEKGGYEMKKDVSASDEDMMTLLMKMKELTESKGLEDIYKTEASYGTPEGKFLSEKTYSSEDSAMKKIMAGPEYYPDKVTDKDVSLAESLYHMKIAGDVETYPDFKMESLMEEYTKKIADEKYNKKMADEKLQMEDAYSLHKVNSEESFMKNVDDMGKSLLKEESYPFIKDGNIEEYLKKVEAEGKGKFYDETLAQPKKAFSLEKTAEEKALDEWKGSHKDLFAAEEGHILGENVKIEGEHGIDGGIAMNDEFMKKFKTSLGIGKELGSENDELLRMGKEMHKEEGIAEGSTAYEKAKEQARKDVHIHLSEEEMKKYLEDALAFGAKDVHGTELSFEKGLAGEKSHEMGTKMETGIDKSLYGNFGEELFKSKEVHGLGEEFDFKKEKAMYGGKASFGDEVKHSIDHEIPFAVEGDKSFKFYEDDLFKKDKAFGTDSLFHEEKKIMKPAGDHHYMLKEDDVHGLGDSTFKKHLVGETMDSEKSHKSSHDLKSKFFELLARVLRTRKCHLVSMRPSELLGIVNCVSKSKDPLLCEKFSMCEKKMPFRVIAAKEKCQKEMMPGEMKCTRYAPLFPSAQIPLKIFQCVALNVGELQPEEKKHVTAFEECARGIKAESCGRFKWFRGPH